MSSDIYALLDELATRGRQRRGQLPGDYKPVDPTDPAADVLASAWAIYLGRQAAHMMDPRPEDGSR